MTVQDYFKLLVDTSASGGFPSANAFACQYRGPDGRKCAAGLLFPDDVQVPELGTVDVLFARKPELEAYIPEGMTTSQVREVQRVHDGLAWNEKLPWNHTAFVNELLSLEVFAGMSAAAA